MNGRLAVLRLCDAMLALVASLLLCLLPASPVSAAKIELTDLLDIDPLGYTCVPAQYFDDQPDGSAALAFSVSKKTRLPRTCLPDPCARALTRTELSGITGTEPILARFSEEWDDYFSRYADHCVREVTVSRPRDETDFWKPILTSARDRQRLGLPTSSRLIPFVPGFPSLSTDQPILARLGTPISGASLASTVGPSPVPVPPAGLMFGALLGAAALTARRRRRRVSK